MKAVSLRALTGYLFVAGIIAACGSSSDSTGAWDDGGATSDASYEGGSKDSGSWHYDGGGVDSGGGGDDGSQPTGDGGSCTTIMCTNDSECMNACPSSGGGIWCCDIGSATCYQTTSAMCPVAPDGATLD
jgi:hypothetical protein